MSTLTNVEKSAPAASPARAAQAEWAQQPVGVRLGAIRRLRHALAANADPLCEAVRADLGKSAAETLACELLPWAEACRFMERRAASILRPRRVPGSDLPLWLWGQRDTVFRRPRGVVGIIGTWNYPLYLNGVQIAQALAAGNAVLWKPSEVAPRSADALWAVLQQSGVPQNLLARLPATREAGKQLTDGDIDHVVFTGHAETGRRIAAHLGQRLISSTLELSGCDVMFVLADADLELAARAAWYGITLNSGQTCLAVRRVFVERSVQAPFGERLENLARNAKPLHLALASQRTQAERLIEEAVASGARRLGDTAEEPDLMRPTIVFDARTDMAVCREATFAPVLAVIPFESLDEALTAQRACDYALGASIFTRRVEKAANLASRLRTGSVSINDVIAPTAHPATPFGGTGASGWGVTQGVEGLLEMTVPQVVSVRSGRWRPHYDPPGSSSFTSSAMLRGVLEWSHAGNWRERWRGLWNIICAYRKPGAH
jgi:acyl-CoA reductase-like NAD-dependent aldehyde dehydrogenase